MKKKKKALKAKKNKLQFKKNKTLKKCKKVKRSYKTRRKFKKKKKIIMEEIYSIINRVQLGDKEYSFSASLEDAYTFENMIRDTGLKYKKSELNTKVNFILYPPKDRQEDIDIVDHLEILEDEIPDVDQIF